jgi:chromosome segregation ATPase
MSDEGQVQTETNGSGVNDGNAVTVEDLQTELEKKDKEIESIKSAQTGVDRANTELRKELEDLRNSLKEKMSESEKASYEQQKKDDYYKGIEEKLSSFEAREAAREFKELKQQILKDNDLNDFDLVDVIAGSNKDEFIANVKIYKDKFSSLEKNVKTGIMNQSTPVKGASDGSGMTQEKFDNMGISERQLLFIENPEIFKKFDKSQRY